MGFVTLEKSEREELFKQRKPYAMSLSELKQLREKHIKEQLQVKNYLKALEQSGGSKTDIKTAKTILLALKTIDTQIGSLMRNARR